MNPQPKPLRVIDPGFKYWLIDNKCCVITGAPAQAGHHLPNPEGGKRRSRDDLQIPVTTEIHMWLHKHPEEERKLLDKFYALAKQYYEEYRIFRDSRRKGRCENEDSIG
jgi:hypothetical protein